MSDTPETDAAIISSNGQWSFVLKETCCRLESERNEARKETEYYKERYEQLKDERDEAREEIKRLRYEAQKEAEHHDRMVKEIEGLYDQLAKTKPRNEHICSLNKDMTGNCIICDG